MFGMSLPEIAIVLVLALIVFGPERIPTLAKTLGKALREMRKATAEVRRTLDVEDVRRDLRARNQARERAREAAERRRKEAEERRKKLEAARKEGAEDADESADGHSLATDETDAESGTSEQDEDASEPELAEPPVKVRPPSAQTVAAAGSEGDGDSEPLDAELVDDSTHPGQPSAAQTDGSGSVSTSTSARKKEDEAVQGAAAGGDAAEDEELGKGDIEDDEAGDDEAEDDEEAHRKAALLARLDAEDRRIERDLKKFLGLPPGGVNGVLHATRLPARAGESRAALTPVALGSKSTRQEEHLTTVSLPGRS